MRPAVDAARPTPGWPPDDFMERARAFQQSRVLLTAIELDLYSAVGAGATSAQVAARLSTDPRATEMLLNALVALGMLAKQGGVFRNGPLAGRFLTAGSPEDARAAMLHTVHMWERWSTLTACVKAGTAVSYQEYEDRDPKWTEAFIAAMHANSFQRAPRVIKAVGLEGVNRLLDVGGGSGAYAIAFAQARPQLRAVVFDLPRVVRIAEGHIARAGLSDRVKTRVGDLRRGRFGRGYDLVLLSSICHMLGPQENLRLLKRCRAALRPGGRLVIQDFVLAPHKTAPRVGVLFSLTMLVGTREGASYSQPEYAAWLAQAGFTEVRWIKPRGPSELIVGRRCS